LSASGIEPGPPTLLSEHVPELLTPRQTELTRQTVCLASSGKPIAYSGSLSKASCSLYVHRPASDATNRAACLCTFELLLLRTRTHSMTLFEVFVSVLPDKLLAVILTRLFVYYFILLCNLSVANECPNSCNIFNFILLI